MKITELIEEIAQAHAKADSELPVLLLSPEAVADIFFSVFNPGSASFNKEPETNKDLLRELYLATYYKTMAAYTKESD